MLFSWTHTVSPLPQNCNQLIQTIEDTGTILREIRDLEEQVTLPHLFPPKLQRFQKPIIKNRISSRVKTLQRLSNPEITNGITSRLIPTRTLEFNDGQYDYFPPKTRIIVEANSDPITFPSPIRLRQRTATRPWPTWRGSWRTTRPSERRTLHWHPRCEKVDPGERETLACCSPSG